MRLGKVTGVVLAFAILFASCNEDEPALLPVANFSYVANELVVTFTNTSQNAVSYAWDFGNGTSSTEKEGVVTYAADGEYKVKLTATNVDGVTHSKEEMITVAKIDPCIAWNGAQSNNILIGGGFETCDTKYWTVIKAGEPGQCKI